MQLQFPRVCGRFQRGDCPPSSLVPAARLSVAATASHACPPDAHGRPGRAGSPAPPLPAQQRRRLRRLNVALLRKAGNQPAGYPDYLSGVVSALFGGAQGRAGQTVRPRSGGLEEEGRQSHRVRQGQHSLRDIHQLPASLRGRHRRPGQGPVPLRSGHPLKLRGHRRRRRLRGRETDRGRSGSAGHPTPAKETRLSGGGAGTLQGGVGIGAAGRDLRRGRPSADRRGVRESLRPGLRAGGAPECLKRPPHRHPAEVFRKVLAFAYC